MRRSTLKNFTFTLDESIEEMIKRANQLQSQVTFFDIHSPKNQRLNAELDALYAEIGFHIAHHYQR